MRFKWQAWCTRDASIAAPVSDLNERKDLDLDEFVLGLELADFGFLWN
jgi:hypothetical protein